MSAASSHYKYGPVRTLSTSEARLLAQLLEEADNSIIDPVSLNSLQVQEMPDGGMGSLYIVHPIKAREDRRFGRRLSKREFHDVDGMLAIASLNLDRDNELFELDIWKCDFSPLIRLPG